MIEVNFMHVAVRQITLRLAENHSLKGKRRVLVGLKTRVRQRYHVSIAQLDKSNVWQLATLGFASISSNAPKLRTWSRWSQISLWDTCEGTPTSWM